MRTSPPFSTCRTRSPRTRRTAIDVTPGDGTWTVTAPAYLLQLRIPQYTAILADPDGRIWSRLSLFASVDRVGVPDESYAVTESRVSTVDGWVEIELAGEEGA